MRARAASRSRSSTGAGRGSPSARCRTPARVTCYDFSEYDRDLEALREGHRAARLPAAAVRARPFDGRGGADPLGAARAALVRPHRADRPDDQSRWRAPARPTRAPRRACCGCIGMGSSYVPGGGGTPINTLPFAGNRLTSDAVRYARTVAIIEAEPSLAIGSPTIAWVDAAFRAMREFADPSLCEPAAPAAAAGRRRTGPGRLDARDRGSSRCACAPARIW